MDHDPMSGMLQTINATTGRLRASLHILTDDQQILRQQFELLLSEVDSLIQQGQMEEQLRERQQKRTATRQYMEFVLDAVRAAAYEFDVREGTVRHSPRLNELYGFLPEAQPTIEEFRSRHHPEDRELMRSIFPQSAHGSTIFQRDMRIILSDGTIRWLHSRGEVELDAEGQPVRVYGAVMDITERKETEERLRESEERFRVLLASWVQAIWETDAAGMVVEDSPTWRAYTGQTLHDWLGEGWVQAVHPDDRAYALRQWQEAVRRVAQVNAEFRLKSPEGGWRWTNVRATPILNSDHTIQKWVGMNIDISERKAAEEALHESEGKYRTLFNSIDEGFCIIEKVETLPGEPSDFRYLETNGAFELQTGLKNVVGKTIRELVPNVEEAAMAYYDRVVTTGEAVRFEVYVSQLDMWIDAYAFPIGEPHERRVAVLFNNVTERVRAEAALRLSEEKYHLLFQSIDEGVAVLELIFSEEQKFTDLIFREVNPAFEWHTGLTHLVGKTVRELLPNFEQDWLEMYRRVRETGELVRTEHYVAEVNRWYKVHFSRMDGPGSHFVSVVFEDITKRKRREQHQAFLSQLTKDLVELKNVDEAIDALGEKIAKYFNVPWCVFGELTANMETINVTAGWNAPAVAFVKGTHKMADLWTEEQFESYNRGETAAVRNTQADSRVNAAGFAALNMMSFIMVPLSRNGDFKFMTGICDTKPRQWRDDEIELAKELTDRIWTWVERARAEQALSEAEAKFRTLSNAAPALIWQNNAQGENLFVNQHFTDFVGMTVEQIRGEGWHTLVHPDDREAYVAHYLAAVREQRSWNNQTRIRRYDGEWRWFDNHAQPLLGEDGIFLGHVGASVDITERKRAEEAMSASEERLRSLFDTMSQGVAIMELVRNDAGAVVDTRYLELNPAFERLTGFDRSGVLGRRTSEVFPQHFLDFQPRLETVEGTAGPERFESYIPETRRWYSFYAAPFGGPDGFVVYFDDITDRKQAEDALRQSEALLRRAMNTPTVGVLFFNLDGKIVDANQTLGQMSGYTVEELCTITDWSELTPPEFIDVTERAARELAQYGETAPYEKQWIRKDGSRWWGLFAPARLGGSGNTSECVEFIVDITGRKQTERALREVEERRLQAVEAGGIGDWETDLILGTIFWSLRTYELFEVSPTLPPSYELMRSRIHPDDQHLLFDVRQAGIRGAIPSRYRVEFRVRRSDGGWRWLEVRDRVIFAEDGGQVAVLVRGTVMDITSRKLAEAMEQDQRLLAETLRDSVAELSSTQELEEVLARAVRVARHLVEYDAATVLLTENGKITHLQSDGLSKREKDSLEVWHHQNPISPTNPLYGAATQTRPLFLTDLKQMKKRFPLKALYSLLIVPILWENKLIGYFTLINRKHKEFGDADLAAFQAFAYQLAAAITNARLFVEAQEAAALKERQQFARDLHDAVSQNLFTASLMTETLVQLWEQLGDNRPEALLEINRVVRGAQAEMRSLLMELRPANLETTQFTKLLDQIITAVRGRKQAEVTLQFEGEPVLPPDVHVAIYRIAQETVNNITKHARATQITVTGRGGENHIELLIQDNGRGFDPNSLKKGLGLLMMRERANAVDAKLNIESSDGRGTSIQVVWSRMPG